MILRRSSQGYHDFARSWEAYHVLPWFTNVYGNCSISRALPSNFQWKFFWNWKQNTSIKNFEIIFIRSVNNICFRFTGDNYFFILFFSKAIIHIFIYTPCPLREFSIFNSIVSFKSEIALDFPISSGKVFCLLIWNFNLWFSLKILK